MTQSAFRTLCAVRTGTLTYDVYTNDRYHILYFSTVCTIFPVNRIIIVLILLQILIKAFGFDFGLSIS